MGWGLHSHFIVKPNLVLRFGWGFDNLVKLACIGVNWVQLSCIGMNWVEWGQIWLNRSELG